MTAGTRLSIHLDTDFGGDIDDLCALAFLLGTPDVEITGVTTVLEDGGRRAGYTRYALALAGRGDVPVAAGADLSLLRFREPSYGLPPEARYWPEPVPPAPGPLDAALDLLARSIEVGATIVAIGPLTNLALLEERSPGTLSRARLVIMGGHLRPAPPGFPRWDHTMDFNLQADPAAAFHALAACEPARTTLVPIEVTAQTALRASDLPPLRAAGALGRLIARQAEAFAEDEGYATRFGRRCAGLPDDLVNFQHDPLACAVALGWDGAVVEPLALSIVLDDGWLRLREQSGGRAFRVATRVDQTAFATCWLAAVTSGT